MQAGEACEGQDRQAAAAQADVSWNAMIAKQVIIEYQYSLLTP